MSRRLLGLICLLGALLPGAAAPTMTMGVLLGEPTLASSNWSGYALQGGPFSTASGTFTVARAHPTCSGDQFVSEWVGIDGVADANLIQAGTTESEYNLNTGNCAAHPLAYAWVEVLPADAQLVPLPVKPGDSVTVSLVDVTPFRWDITMVDDTTGAVYQDNNVFYDGRGESAEWVVETPLVDGNLTSLAAFGHVSFDQLSACCNAALLDEVTLDQGTVTDSAQPSPVASTDALMRGGFEVYYHVTAPNPGY